MSFPLLHYFPRKMSHHLSFLKNTRQEENWTVIFWLARDLPWVNHGLGGLNVHAHFLTNNLNGPPIKYLGSIDYLISQLNEQSPMEYPKQSLINHLGSSQKPTIRKHITQSTRTPMQHHLGPFSSTPVLFTNPKKSHIKPMKPKCAYITTLELNIIGFIEGDSWSPSISQPSTQNGWRQPISGSREDWTQADKRRVVCLLLAEPILGFILLKKRRTTAGPSPPTWQEQSAHHF